MSVSADSTDRLYAWLPAFHRQRDAEQGYPLRALLRVIGEQVDVVEEDIDQLYADWFIETCADWAVPYLGDLIGYRAVPEAGPPGDPATESGRLRNSWLIPRREVANTIALRRRKGTLHVLAQLALDVAGWPAVAVEYYRQLAWAQPVAHVHAERARLARIGGAPAWDVDEIACDGHAHTVDVRRIDSHRRRGRHNIPGIGLHVYRLKPYPVSATPACCVEEVGSHCYTFSVLGNDSPLFATVSSCSPCVPGGTPRPLRRARLQEVIQQHPPVARTSTEYYGPGRSLAIHAPGWPNKQASQPIPADSVIVADLAKWAYSPKAGTLAVDPERGRIAFPPGQLPRQGVRVDYHYGFSADIGGGEYRRHRTEPDLYDQARFDLHDLRDPGAVLLRLRDDSEKLGAYLRSHLDVAERDAIAQWDPSTPPSPALNALLLVVLSRVLSDEDLYVRERFPGLVLSDEMVALQQHAGEAARQARFNRLLLEAAYGDALAPRFRLYHVGGAGGETLASALSRWGTDRPRYAIIEFVESGVYTEPVHVQLQAAQTLQLRAADRTRPVLRLLDYMSDRADAFRVVGATGSRLVLDGLLIAGRGIQVRGPEGGDDESDGDLCELVIRHCTLVPGWSLHCDCEPRRPGEPSLELLGSAASVRIEHSIVGSIEIVRDSIRAAPNAIRIGDSIVDGVHPHRAVIGAGEGRAACAELTIVRSTVLGALTVHAIVLAENSIFTGCVEVARRQQGCMRFCHVPVHSRTPRRFHCQPDMARAQALEALSPDATDAQRDNALEDAALQVRPQFTSTRYGHPGYAQLATDGPVAIARGADDQSEMGVFHDLFQPQRAANLRARLDEYTPVGMETGIFLAT